MSKFDESLKKIKEDRFNWEFKKINSFVKEMAPSEKNIQDKINKILPLGFFIKTAISPMGEKAPFDSELYFTEDRITEKVIAKIEFEEGKTQINWKEKFPDNWSNLNFLARKNYKKSDIFIKHNIDCTSLFAIDSRMLVDLIDKNYIPIKKINHSLKMKTCDDVYLISWDLARKLEKNGFMVLIENNNMDKILPFLKKYKNKMSNL